MLVKYIETFGARNIYIVTNAMEKWVVHAMKEMSRVYQAHCANNPAANGLDGDYYGNLLQLITKLEIQVISAQALHAKEHPQQPTMWKTLVFKKVIKEHWKLQSSKDHQIYRIISIGDSQCEFEAAEEAKKMLLSRNLLNGTDNIVRLHRIKMRESPSINELIEMSESVVMEANVLDKCHDSVTIEFLGKEER